MKCLRIQQWISDMVDGEMSKEIKTNVEAHLEVCPDCQAFRDQIVKINEEMKNLEVPSVSPAQGLEFVTRLRSTIPEFGGKKEEGILHLFRRKWIFVPASVIMISLFILIFVFYDRGDFPDEEFYVFSFGNAVEEIYRDIGSDLVLQQAFHSLVSASISEMLITVDWDETWNFEDELLLWEEFSEEELGNLEPEIKKDRNS